MNYNKGKVVLTSYDNYIACSSTLDNPKIYNIARKPMDSIPQLLGLAPSKELLEFALANKSKKEWFHEFYFRYLDEVVSTLEFKVALGSIIDALDRGIDVVLVCWCINYNNCHRSIVGSILQSRGYTIYR